MSLLQALSFIAAVTEAHIVALSAIRQSRGLAEHLLQGFLTPLIHQPRTGM